MNGKEAIRIIARQTERLMEEHGKAVSQRNALNAECLTLREENRRLQERIKELESELTLAHLNAGLSGDASSRKRARARINRLMREVDRCIAIAGNME